MTMLGSLRPEGLDAEPQPPVRTAEPPLCTGVLGQITVCPWVRRHTGPASNTAESTAANAFMPISIPPAAQVVKNCIEPRIDTDETRTGPDRSV
jgi:hypothetical protein